MELKELETRIAELEVRFRKLKIISGIFAEQTTNGCTHGCTGACPDPTGDCTYGCTDNCTQGCTGGGCYAPRIDLEQKK